MEGTLENVFGNAETVNVEADEKAAKKRAERKEKLDKMEELLKDTIKNDPTFAERHHRLSEAIEVINVYGYGRSGGLLETAPETSEEGRKLAPVAATVGYRLKNVSTETIDYTTEEYVKNEEGIYVGKVVSKKFAPGETIDLTTMYTTMFASRPEISFTFANGILVASSRKKSTGNAVKDLLSSFYFKPDTGLFRVNDDDIKINIDNEDGTLKPEYEATFGYLVNPAPVKAAKKKKSQSGTKFSVQDFAANFVQTKLKDMGM